MANPGNTGYRYHLRTIADFTIEDETYVRRHLSCGHSVRHNAETAEKAHNYIEDAQKDLGKRTRCPECPPRQ